MGSPFEFFRRHTWLMVALLGLSIFAFILSDTLVSGGPDVLPVILGVILGAIALVLLSGASGRMAVVWGIAGAVAGGLFVGVGSNYFTRGTAIPMAGGDISTSRLEELRVRRGNANEFVRRLSRELAEDYPESRDVRPVSFSYADSGYLPRDTTNDSDILFGEIMAREADRLGLAVSNDEITRFIKEGLGEKPKRGVVGGIRRDLRLGQTELYDALRGELQGRRAFELLAPTPRPTPGDFWSLYRGVTQKADLAVAPLPVEAFLASAPEPGAGEVETLFEENKEQPADPVTGLGFRRPNQVKLAYFEADRTAVSAATPDPTDAEVEAYYEENKNIYRNPAYTDWRMQQLSDALPGSEEQAEEPTEPAAEDPAEPTAPPTLPALPGMEEPADDPEPTAEPDNPAEPAAEAEPVAGAASTEEGEGEPAAEPEQPAAEDRPAGDDPAADGAVRGAFLTRTQDGEATPRDPVTAPRPSVRLAEGQDGENEEPAADPPAEMQDDATTDEPADDPEAATAEPMEPRAGEDGQEFTPPPAPTDAAPKDPPPEYLPLDEARREQIRTELKRDRVQRAIARKLQEAEDAVFALTDRWAEVPAEGDESGLSEEEIAAARDEARADIAKRAEAYAEENGLTYSETGFLSFEDSGDPEVQQTYPVLQALEGTANDDPFARRNRAVDLLFTNLETPLFGITRSGTDAATGNGYVVWKPDQRADGVQSLDDPGVRDLVIAAFKRQKAVEAARARAEALAEKASAEGTTLAQACEGETVTGEEGADPIVVTGTGPFARLTLLEQTFDINRAYQPLTNRVPTVGAVEAAFYDLAFDELAEGEAGVAADEREETVYALELTSREPDGEALAEAFPTFVKQAAEQPYRYNFAGADALVAARRAFVDRMLEKYNVGSL